MWEMFCKTNDSIKIWTELFNDINKSATSLHSSFVLVLCFRATSMVAPIYPDFPPLPFILNNFSVHYAGPLFHLHSMSQMGPYSCPLKSADKPLLPEYFNLPFLTCYYPQPSSWPILSQRMTSLCSTKESSFIVSASPGPSPIWDPSLIAQPIHTSPCVTYTSTSIPCLWLVFLFPVHVTHLHRDA
jgi:hypothetical protein